VYTFEKKILHINYDLKQEILIKKIFFFYCISSNFQALVRTVCLFTKCIFMGVTEALAKP
jgi:hypothetical protein